MSSLKERDQKAVWHPFTPYKSISEILPIVKAEGVYLYTEDGQKILDAISSWWVNLHGHSHPYLAKAIYEQALQLEHVIFAGFTHEPATRLAERLLVLLPDQFSKVFYSDNGSTATEVALKFALQFFWNNGKTQRKKIIAIEGAYHGDTFGAMSVGDRGAFITPFAHHLFDVEFLPFPSPEKEVQALEKLGQLAQTGEVAAFIFEPLVQGASGMQMYPAKWLDEAISIAQKNEVLCIADEVMTGFGRTGKNFAADHLQNKPDLICLSKGLTGGAMALGVTVCSEKIEAVFKTSDFMKTFFHGHSFTANPMACAVANASLDLLLKESCQQAIKQIGEQHTAFSEKAHSLTKARNIRQLGTIFALDMDTYEYTSYFNEARGYLYQAFLEKGILLRPLGNVIYILPPYCITKEELEEVYAAIVEVFEKG